MKKITYNYYINEKEEEELSKTNPSVNLIIILFY